MHLSSLNQMLPYLASAGHSHYTKSVHLYLQKMSKLESDHPDVYRRFLGGYHVVRLSNRHWAGLSVDLLIEQVLSFKTYGGLTRGSGMSEQQRHLWLQSMPACMIVNNTMQELTGVRYETSEQHKEMSKSRIDRDAKDTVTLLFALQDRNPFCQDSELMNIMTGVCATPKVNVDDARRIGQKILKSMEDQKVVEYTFKKSSQAVTMMHKSVVMIDGEAVQVDPELMFQRLIVAARSNTPHIEDIFMYELSNKPLSLIDVNGCHTKWIQVSFG